MERQGWGFEGEGERWSEGRDGQCGGVYDVVLLVYVVDFVLAAQID